MSEWMEISLGDVCDIYDGPHATPTKQERGLVFLGISSLGFDGRIDPAHFEYVSEESFRKWTRRIQPQTDDIVFSYETKLGVAAIIPPDFECCLGRRMGLLRPKENIHSKFLLYAYLAPDFQKTIYERTIHGSTVDRIPLKDMAEFPIFVPSISEQKAIAAVLGSLDDKIDLLHRQNQTLEAMAATLFRQWFVEEAQEDWEVGKLGNEFDFTMGQSPSGSSFNEDGVGVPMFQGNADFEFRFPKERIYTTEPTRYAQRLDTLISVRAPVGAQNMAHKKCCIGRGVAAFRYKANNDFYTYTYFKLHSLMEEIKKFNDEGTVFGSISKSDFDALESIVYPPELIVKFEKVAKPINDKVIENCAQIQTLEKLCESLLPKLMSSEVRVAA